MIVNFLLITIVTAQQLVIQKIEDSPVLLIKEKECKIQTGTMKMIHPINMTVIENTIQLLTSTSYNKLSETNPLTNIVKLKIKQLYNTYYGLRPKRHRRKRWDAIGTAFKFIAGTPDAQDLRIINFTMNELITQNNEQYKVNMQLDERVSRLTDTINKVIENSLSNKLIFNEIETITTILNIDNINHLLDNIQDAITLSKSSLVSNKILSLKELNTVKTLLQDQGVTIDFPDEALQFVIPKLALKDDTLLYMLNVPRLENTTSIILRIYPLVTNNRILHQYPTHVIKRSNLLYTTTKPDDFVQKSSYLSELHDNCLTFLINGKQANCSSIMQNKTTQQLITENSILISNAKGQNLQSNCGPDNRTLNGNLLVTFTNCTVVFNGQTFKNTELVSEVQIIQSAFHNLKINWKWHRHFEIEKISNDTISNRNKLDHIYLKQEHTHIKLWSIIGAYTFVQIICILTISLILFKKISSSVTKPKHPGFGTGRSELQGGAVTYAPAIPTSIPQRQAGQHTSSIIDQQIPRSLATDHMDGSQQSTSNSLSQQPTPKGIATTGRADTSQHQPTKLSEFQSVSRTCRQ